MFARPNLSPIWKDRLALLGVAAFFVLTVAFLVWLISLSVPPPILW